jgi:hypothetical protein
MEKMKKAAASVEKVDGDLKKGEEEMKLKEVTVCVGNMYISNSGTPSERLLLELKIDKRIMKLSPEQLQEEATFKEGDEWSVLTVATACRLSVVSIARLCNTVNINTKDKVSRTAILQAAYNGDYDLVDYLAMMKADLSIIAINGDDVYSIVETHEDVSQEDKEQTYRVLKKHGVTGAKIKKGYRSPLSTSSESVSILLPKKLAQEMILTRFFIRVMTLDVEDLAREAKELRDDGLGNAFTFAAANVGMEVAIERLWGVWCGSVNINYMQGVGTAIMQVAYYSIAANVNTLATMGTDLSLTNIIGANVFHHAEQSAQPPDEKVAVFKALSEHGVKSGNIPQHYQSPLYFRSIYYKRNLRTQRWMNRSMLMMCLSRVYGWSLSNQREDERYRTLPDDLPKLGRFICKCWFDVAGGDNKVDDDQPDNGIARLIMSFAFGFNDSKSPFALIGMPECGKVPDTLTRCSCCVQHIKKGMLQCCSHARYCSIACQKAHIKEHKPVCQNEAYLLKRAEVAARVASLRAAMEEKAEVK